MTDGHASIVKVAPSFAQKPSGGRGKPALDWWLSEDSPAELVAVTDVSRDKVWLFRHEEFERLAQQRSSGRLHMYFFVEAGSSRVRQSGETDHEAFLLKNKVAELFRQPITEKMLEEPHP